MSSSVPKKVGRPQGRSREQTREAILKSARSSFVENGYGGSTFKDVARRSGLTPAALYTHFASKAELYSATLEYSYLPLLPSFQNALTQQGSFRDKLRGILMAAVDAHEKDRELMAFLVEFQVEVARRPEVREYNSQYHEATEKILDSIFQQAMNSGEVPAHLSAEDLKATFIGSTIGMASFDICTESNSMRKGVETLLDLLNWR